MQHAVCCVRAGAEWKTLYVSLSLPTQKQEPVDGNGKTYDNRTTQPTLLAESKVRTGPFVFLAKKANLRGRNGAQASFVVTGARAPRPREAPSFVVRLGGGTEYAAPGMSVLISHNASSVSTFHVRYLLSLSLAFISSEAAHYERSLLVITTNTRPLLTRTNLDDYNG